MGSFLLKRLVEAVVTMLVMTALVFGLSHLIPGDPAFIAAGPRATPQEVEALRVRMGLDKPLTTQYLLYLKGLLHGDLGRSIVTERPVSADITKALPASLELALFATLIWLPLALGIGVLCAVKAGGGLDLAVRGFSILGVSMPVFWVALLLQLAFARILPIAGRVDVGLGPARITGFYLLDSLLKLDWSAFGNALKHIWLPAIALSIGSVARTGRLTRACVLEVINETYVASARAKGLRERSVLVRHVFRNALIPVTTIVGLQIGDLIAWVFLVETIFAWPGIGRYLVTAILELDYAPVMGTVLIVSLMYVTINTAVDLLYARFDPRVRY